jgi:hypothetical protein
MYHLRISGTIHTNDGVLIPVEIDSTSYNHDPMPRLAELIVDAGYEYNDLGNMRLNITTKCRSNGTGVNAHDTVYGEKTLAFLEGIARSKKEGIPFAQS